jgi:hypothetical protein
LDLEENGTGSLGVNVLQSQWSELASELGAS